MFKSSTCFCTLQQLCDNNSNNNNNTTEVTLESCQRTHLGCNPVSHVSACWLTGLGLGTPSRYLARTISWNACKLLLLLLLIVSCSSFRWLNVASPVSAIQRTFSQKRMSKKLFGNDSANQSLQSWRGVGCVRNERSLDCSLSVCLCCRQH